MELQTKVCYENAKLLEFSVTPENAKDIILKRTIQYKQTMNRFGFREMEAIPYNGFNDIDGVKVFFPSALRSIAIKYSEHKECTKKKITPVICDGAVYASWLYTYFNMSYIPENQLVHYISFLVLNYEILTVDNYQTTMVTISDRKFGILTSKRYLDINREETIVFDYKIGDAQVQSSGRKCDYVLQNSLQIDREYYIFE